MPKNAVNKAFSGILLTRLLTRPINKLLPTGFYHPNPRGGFVVVST